MSSTSPIDSAWSTRLPPGWVQFPDGSIGPPNQPSPIDSAWGTRVPMPGGASTPGGGGTGLGGGMGYPQQGLVPQQVGGAPAGMSTRVGYPGIPSSTSSALGAPAPMSAPGTSLNTTGPQIFGPSRRTPRPGWPNTGETTDAVINDPALSVGGGSNPLGWLLSGRTGVPGLVGAGMAAGVPATRIWNQTTNDPWLQDPNNAGGIPGWFGSGLAPSGPGQATAPSPGASYRPEDSPSFTAPNPYGAGMPRGGTPAGPPAAPARPVAPTAANPTPVASRAPAAPVAAPVAAPAAAANLGYGVPGTFQYNVAGSPGASGGPQGVGRGGMNTSPIYTAMQFGGRGAPPASAPPAAGAIPPTATAQAPTSNNLPSQRLQPSPSALAQAQKYHWPFNLIPNAPGYSSAYNPGANS